MKATLENLLAILESLTDNCGDNRGRDGEYLSDQACKAQEMCLKLVQDQAASAVIDKVLESSKDRKDYGFSQPEGIDPGCD